MNKPKSETPYLRTHLSTKSPGYCLLCRHAALDRILLLPTETFAGEPKEVSVGGRVPFLRVFWVFARALLGRPLDLWFVILVHIVLKSLPINNKNKKTTLKLLLLLLTVGLLVFAFVAARMFFWRLRLVFLC